MLYLDVSTQILFIIILLALIFVLFIKSNIISPILRKKKVIELINIVSEKNNFHFNISEKQKYDFLLENEKTILLIKTAYVPLNSVITINNKSTWSLTYGSSKSRPGRSYPNQRYMSELIPFLNFTMESDKKCIKVVLIYPGTDKVQKYINESEITILRYKDTAYDYKIITYNDFEGHFEDLI